MSRAWWGALALAAAGLAATGCMLYGRSHYPRHKPYYEPPPQPPPEEEAIDPRYGVPESYAEGVRRLSGLERQIRELANAGRRFEIPEHAIHVEAVARALPGLVKKEVTSEVVEKARRSGELLVDIADLLVKAAKNEDKAQAAALVEEIAPQVAELKAFESLSDEYELKKVPENCPNTYKRALARMQGVENGLRDRLKTDRLWEIPDVAEYLRVVGQYLEAIAKNDILWPVEQSVKQASESLRLSARRLRTASGREDETVAIQAAGAIGPAVRELDKVWTQFSGKSALEPEPEGTKDPPIEPGPRKPLPGETERDGG